jgi:hypothetical protein
MKNKALWILLLAAAFTVSLASDVKAAEKTITIDLTEMSVQDALESILDKAEVNYVLKAGITGRIDKLHFRSVSFSAALESIVQTSNLTYELEDGIYIISPKDPPKQNETRLATASPRTTEPTALVPDHVQDIVPSDEILFYEDGSEMAASTGYFGHGDTEYVDPYGYASTEHYYQPMEYVGGFFSVPIRPYFISPPYEYQFMARYHSLPPAPWRRMPRVNGVPIFW